MERTTTFDDHSNSMPLPLPSSIFSHLPVGPFYANLINQQFGAAMKSTALQPVRDGNAARSRIDSSTASVSSHASTVKASNRDMTIVSSLPGTVVPTSQIEEGNCVSFHPFHGRSLFLCSWRGTFLNSHNFFYHTFSYRRSCFAIKDESPGQSIFECPYW